MGIVAMVADLIFLLFPFFLAFSYHSFLAFHQFFRSGSQDGQELLQVGTVCMKPSSSQGVGGILVP